MSSVFLNENKILDKSFDFIKTDSRSAVYEIFPTVFSDNRGWFAEKLKCDMSWVKQTNRSSSVSGVIRGCHAQKGQYCQSKLVEAVNRDIFDIITDARPWSSTFGVSKVYKLDAIKQNMLYIPKGFLHAFYVPYDENNNQSAIFNYYCGNVFDKKSEVSINPMTILPNVFDNLKRLCEKDANMYNTFSKVFDDNTKTYSEKDKNGFDFECWMAEIAAMWFDTRTLWYK